MDQRSDDIRQDIESTRAALDEKLDTLETKARQTFDLKYQVAERPWIALGAAVAAGFVVGNMGGDEEQRWHGQPVTTTDYNQHATYTAPARQEKSSVDSLFSQFDDEIEMIKGAALSALTNFLHDSIRAYLPAMGNYQRLKPPIRPDAFDGDERIVSDWSQQDWLRLAADDEQPALERRGGRLRLLLSARLDWGGCARLRQDLPPARRDRT